MTWVMLGQQSEAATLPPCQVNIAHRFPLSPEPMSGSMNATVPLNNLDFEKLDFGEYRKGLSGRALPTLKLSVPQSADTLEIPQI